MYKIISNLLFLFIVFSFQFKAIAQVTTTGTATICENNSTIITAIPDPALVGLTTFVWQPGSLTGISETVTPLVTTTYTVTATNGINNFISTVLITVNPLPILTAVASETICNGVNTSNINFVTSIASDVAWTNSNITIGLVGAGNNAIASFVATNPSSTIANIGNFIATPTSTVGSCVGAASTFTINVNPTPVVNLVASPTICNGSITTAINFVSSVASNVAWTNNNPSIGLSGSGNNTIASFVATNASSTIANVGNFVATPTSSSGGCAGLPINFNITVNPTPVVAAVSSQTICTGSNTAVVNFASSVASNVAWTNSNPAIGLPGSGNNTIASFVATNASSTITNVGNFIATPTSTVGSCVGLPINFSITVNPTPLVSGVSSQIICNGSNTATINFASSVASNIAWTNSNPSIGLIGAGNNSIASFVASNASNIIANVGNFVATPTSIVGSCIGLPTNFSITINPTPVVSAVASQAICNGSNTATINFVNSVASNIAWTNSNSSIGVASSGNNTIASFASTNGSSVAANVGNFIATPTSTIGSCIGLPINFSITVNPTPILSAVSSQTICNTSSSSAIVFVTSVASNVAWTNSNNTIGLPSSGNNTIASFVASNASSTATNIGNFVGTPTSTIGSCVGLVRTFTITVNPSPIVTSVSPITVCSGVVPIIDVSTDALELLNWSIVSSSPLLSGISPNNFPSAAKSFDNSVTNNLPSNVFTNTVIYNLIPTSSNGCVGLPVNYTINVKPGSSPTPIGNQILCDGFATSLITFTTNTPGAIFNWTNSSPSIGLANAGTGTTIPSFIATNTSSSIINALITVTDIAGTCSGGINTFTITVNPTPIVDAVASQSVCNGSNSAPVSFTSAVPSSFDWSNLNSSIGIAGFGTNNISSFVATNVSGTITNIGAFTVIPTSTIGGCIGNPSTFTITVNPTPVISAVPSISLCNTFTTSAISFVSSVSCDFNWTNSNPSIGVSSGINTIPSFTSSNINPFVDAVGIFTVTPISTNLCIGAATTFSITVHPTPILTPISNQTLCNTFNTNRINFISTDTSNFTWAADVNVGIGLSGAASSSFPFIESFAASNISDTFSATSIFTITPTSINAGCIGASQTFSIVVHPTPLITQIADVTICNGLNTSSILFNSSTPSSFGWINNNFSIGILNAGSGAINSFTAIDTSNTLPTASVFTVTPTSTLGSCVGTNATFTIIVKPSSKITNVLSQELCNASKTDTIKFISSVSGSTFTWSNNNSAIGLTNSGAGDIPSFIATNSGNVNTIIGEIIVIPTSGGSCIGSTDTFTITVHPTPTVTVSSPERCSNQFTNITLNPSTIGNNTFRKIVDSNTGLILGTSNQSFSTTITQDSLTSPSFTAAQTVKYAITIKSAFGCSDSNGISKTKISQSINPIPQLLVLSDTICSRGNISYLPTASTLGNSVFDWTILNNNTNGFTQISSLPLENSSTNVDGNITSSYITDKNIDVKIKRDSLTYLYTITSDKGCINTQSDNIGKDRFVLYIKPTPNPFVSITPVDAGLYCKQTRHQLYKIGRPSIPTENINWRFANVVNTNIYQSPDSTNTFAMLRSDDTNSILVTSTFDGFAECAINSTVPFVIDRTTSTVDPTLIIKKYSNGNVVLECLANNITGDYKWGKVNKNSLIETIYTGENGQEYLMKSSNSDDTAVNFYFVEIKLNADNCNRRIYLKDAKLGNKLLDPNANSATAFAMKVYPNPSNDKINIMLEGAWIGTEYNIHIHDIIGNIIYTANMQSNPFTTSIEQLQTGCYFISCTQNGKTIATQKIIKK